MLYEVITRLLSYVARRNSRELFILSITAIGLGIGYATYLFGLSFAFGAFIRITSYNVCYTKLLRSDVSGPMVGHQEGKCLCIDTLNGFTLNSIETINEIFNKQRNVFLTST